MCWEREYPYIPSTTYSIYYILNTHQYLHYWHMSIVYILHLGVHILYTHIPCIVCTIWLHWIAGARHGSVSSPSSAHMAGFMADICFYVVRPTWQDRHQEKNSHNIHRNRAALCCQHNVARQRSAIRYNYSSNPSQIRNILHHNQHQHYVHLSLSHFIWHNLWVGVPT